MLRATRKKKLLDSRRAGQEGGDRGRIHRARCSPRSGPVIEALLEKGFVPVVSPVAMGEDAEPLNVDSDRAAAYLAMGVHADAVLFLTDVKGFLMDGKVVERLTAEEARALPSRRRASGCRRRYSPGSRRSRRASARR